MIVGLHNRLEQTRQLLLFFVGQRRSDCTFVAIVNGEEMVRISAVLLLEIFPKLILPALVLGQNCLALRYPLLAVHRIKPLQQLQLIGQLWIRGNDPPRPLKVKFVPQPSRNAHRRHKLCIRVIAFIPQSKFIQSVRPRLHFICRESSSSSTEQCRECPRARQRRYGRRGGADAQCGHARRNARSRQSSRHGEECTGDDSGGTDFESSNDVLAGIQRGRLPFLVAAGGGFRPLRRLFLLGLLRGEEKLAHPRRDGLLDGVEFS
mmetsp:Transcript_40129/g.121010  ORF Transcript_40129/g.121010 Transcript_40129/m.121010 type:complete len:263 (-) Transcript_40129:546-1334(-)